MSELKKDYDQPCKLMVETIRMIRERGIENTAFETLVPFGWLYKVCNGTFKNPSINRIVHIYETLSKTKVI